MHVTLKVYILLYVQFIYTSHFHFAIYLIWVPNKSIGNLTATNVISLVKCHYYYYTSWRDSNQSSHFAKVCVIQGKMSHPISPHIHITIMPSVPHYEIMEMIWHGAKLISAPVDKIVLTESYEPYKLVVVSTSPGGIFTHCTVICVVTEF